MTHELPIASATPRACNPPPQVQGQQRLQWRTARLRLITHVSALRTQRTALIGSDTVRLLTMEQPVAHVHRIAQQRGRHLDYSSAIAEAVKLPGTRSQEMDELIQTFMFVIPRVGCEGWRAPLWMCSGGRQDKPCGLFWCRLVVLWQKW